MSQPESGTQERDRERIDEVSGGVCIYTMCIVIDIVTSVGVVFEKVSDDQFVIESIELLV